METKITVQTRFEELCAKYPEAMAHADKKVGVFFLSEERKFAVLIHCADCGTDRVVRTSDLQWDSASYCLACAKNHKKAGSKAGPGVPTAKLVNGKLIINVPACLATETKEASPGESDEEVEETDEAMVASEPETLT